MDQSKWTNTCCNPFGISHHSSKKKNLRPAQPWMIKKVPIIKIGQKVCDSCRKKIAKTTGDSSESDEDETVVFKDDVTESVETVNLCLDVIGETPICQRKLQQVKYPKKKLNKIKLAMKKKIMPEEQELSETDDEAEIIKQLKDKFNKSSDRSGKVQILTVLPKSWSIRKVQEEFEATNYMVHKAKELVRQKGILSTPNPKPGHELSEETVHLVQNFFESEEISRTMPGKKDFISVRQGHQRVHVQKRLVLTNLKESYQLFKDKFPTKSVGFSKFADLRPKHCVLAGASGTHDVCVCTIHQNVKLMMVGGKIPAIVLNSVPLKTYDHCFAQIICNPPSPSCYLGDCSSCPGIDQFKEQLMNAVDDNLIDIITYKEWASVDRSTLETFVKPVEEFVECFCDRLEALLPHSFIAKQQSSFQLELKGSLMPGEFLVLADFSENYSFVLQDAAQGFHWNNSQATIHPFVIYYRDSDELHHISYVVISECLHHDTVAVYLFQKNLIKFLKEKFLPCKIFYFSDGSAAQYKNRKNLCLHKADFGITAEWHFSATSHGKGACDGLEGTVKRLAA